MQKTLAEQLIYISQNQPLTKPLSEMDKYLAALNDLGSLVQEVIKKMNIQDLSMSLNTNTFFDGDFKSMYLLPPKFKINNVVVDISELSENASDDVKDFASQLFFFHKQLSNVFYPKYVAIPIWMEVTEKEFVIKNM